MATPAGGSQVGGLVLKSECHVVCPFGKPCGDRGLGGLNWLLTTLANRCSELVDRTNICLTSGANRRTLKP